MTDSLGPAKNPPPLQHAGWASPPADGTPQPAVSLWTRLVARLLADRYDGMLAVGAVADTNSALGIHARRLLTTAEREAVARSFRESLQEARTPPAPWRAQSWAHRPNIVAAADLIDTVTLRLHSPRPVDARGMARLRLLLADSTGPLYICGRGDLMGRLRAALAAL